MITKGNVALGIVCRHYVEGSPTGPSQDEPAGVRAIAVVARDNIAGFQDIHDVGTVRLDVGDGERARTAPDGSFDETCAVLYQKLYHPFRLPQRSSRVGPGDRAWEKEIAWLGLLVIRAKR